MSAESPSFFARQFSRQAAEIAADPALRAYGAVLSLLHVLFAWWITQGGHLAMLAPAADAVCWPLVPFCESLRVLPVPVLGALVTGQALVGVVAALLFARERTVPAAVALLAGLVVFEVGILSLDFRLRRNQHYMALATTLTFLLAPRKRDSVRMLIVLFYVWAGTLKLDREWLSGAALYRPLWLFTGRGVVAACVYVVAMELVVAWGLVARGAIWFWSAYAQVLVFHVFSWGIVGYFYPVLMFGLLAIFPLSRLLAGPPSLPGTASLGLAFVTGRAARSTYAVAALLSALQLVPLVMPGDTALTGEGRLYALNMFDARIECESTARLQLADGKVKIQRLGQFTENRTRCDPLLARAAALALCRRGAIGRVPFTRLDLSLKARRATDSEMHTLVDIPDFCARPPGYNPFFHNEWIRAVGR